MTTKQQQFGPINSIVLNLDTDEYFSVNGSLYRQEFPVNSSKAMQFTRIYENEPEALRHVPNPLKNHTSVIVCPKGLPPRHTCQFARDYVVEQLRRLQEIGVKYSFQDLSMTYEVHKMVPKPKDNEGKFAPNIINGKGGKSGSEDKEKEIENQNIEPRTHITDFQRHYDFLDSIFLKENRVNLLLVYEIKAKTQSNRHINAILAIGIINFLSEELKLQFTTSLNKKYCAKPGIKFLQTLQKQFKYETNIIFVNFHHSMFPNTDKNKKNDEKGLNIEKNEISETMKRPQSPLNSQNKKPTKNDKNNNNNKKGAKKQPEPPEIVIDPRIINQETALKLFYNVVKDVAEVEEADLSPRERSAYNMDLYESQLALLKREYEEVVNQKRVELAQDVDYKLRLIYNEFLENPQGNNDEEQQDEEQPLEELIKPDPVSLQYEKYIKRSKNLQEDDKNIEKEKSELVDQYGPLYQKILQSFDGDTAIKAQADLQDCLNAVRKKLEALQEADLDMQILKNQEIIQKGQTIAQGQALGSVPIENAMEANEKAREQRKKKLMEQMQKEMKLKKLSKLEMLCKKYNYQPEGKKPEGDGNDQNNRESTIAEPVRGATILSSTGLANKTMLLRRSQEFSEEFKSFDYIDYSSFVQICVVVKIMEEASEPQAPQSLQKQKELKQNAQAQKQKGKVQNQAQKQTDQEAKEQGFKYRTEKLMIFSPLKTARFLESVAGQDLYMVQNYTEEVPEELKSIEEDLYELGFSKFYSNYGLFCLWKSNQRVLIVMHHEAKYVIHRLKQKAESQNQNPRMVQNAKGRPGSPGKLAQDRNSAAGSLLNQSGYRLGQKATGTAARGGSALGNMASMRGAGAK